VAPGLSFSEYNPGCETSIGGGVAQADLLGVFGREGVFAATAWPMHSIIANFLVAAFDLFRNYDGNGAVVGDLAVLANSSDYKNTSVYAFAHSDATAGIEVVAINKNTSTQSVTIQLAGVPALTSATLYQLAGKTAAVARVGGTAPGVFCAGGAGFDRQFTFRRESPGRQDQCRAAGNTTCAAFAMGSPHAPDPTTGF
jgi:hypothetical protein